MLAFQGQALRSINQRMRAKRGKTAGGESRGKATFPRGPSSPFWLVLLAAGSLSDLDRRAREAPARPLQRAWGERGKGEGGRSGGGRGNFDGGK